MTKIVYKDKDIVLHLFLHVAIHGGLTLLGGSILQAKDAISNIIVAVLVPCYFNTRRGKTRHQRNSCLFYRFHYLHFTGSFHELA